MPPLSYTGAVLQPARKNAILTKCATLLLPCSCWLALRCRFGQSVTRERLGQVVARLADPQISPDSKSVAVLVSRANFEENRYDAQLVPIDAVSRAQRILVRELLGLSSPRWSADGKRLAFLAQLDGKAQVFALPMDGGGEAIQLTSAPKGVQQFAWSPDASRVAYVTEDVAARVTGPERHNKAFEVGNNDFLVATAQLPSHLWVVMADGTSKARRLTSGSWTLPKSMPPSSPSSPVNWTPDGKSIVFVKVATPYRRRRSEQHSVDRCRWRPHTLAHRPCEERVATGDFARWQMDQLLVSARGRPSQR